jgi:hypothetical protein
MRFIGIALIAVVVACGDGRQVVGGDCDVDSDCPSNICWDFHAYDSLCGGKVCSAKCETDQACVDMAEDAGASSPDRAQCGDDQRCDLVGTGLGSFVCA